MFTPYAGLMVWDATHMSVVANRKRAWPRYYAALLKYGDEYGNCNVPSRAMYECDIVEDGQVRRFKGRLGMWLKEQRLAKRGVGGRPLLPEDRMRLLQQLVDAGTRLHASYCLLVTR
jgi:Helicase associated domain